MGSDIGWEARDECRAMARSLRTRLLLAVSVLAIAAIAAVAFSARQGTRMEFKRLQDVERRTSPARIDQWAARLGSMLDGRCCEAASISGAAANLTGNDLLLVLDAQGNLIGSGGPGAAELSGMRTWLAQDSLHLDFERMHEGSAEQVTLEIIGRKPARIARADGAPALVYVMPIPSRGRDPASIFLGSVDRRLLIVTSLVAVVVVGLTWALTSRMVRPIAELRSAARDLAHGQLSRRVATRGADEIAELGHSFNAMAAELERQETLRRQLVNDVAHELRTPLTALRCRLETMIDGLATDPGAALAGANEEVGHLSRLVDDLQELALTEARELRLNIDVVNLADVARSAARAAGLDADPRLSVEIATTLRARGDVVRVRQMIVNLLTNADRHTPAEGRITIRGAAHGGEVHVEVHNTGSTIAADQLPRVFDRFYRADPARQRSTGGSGLGLAIVKHLAEAQRGTVSVTSDETGVTFGLGLPRM